MTSPRGLGREPPGSASEGHPPIEAPDVGEAVRAARSLRRRLYELEASQRWVHHAADLESGEVMTTPLDRPATPLSRAEGLARLGHPVDPSVFDGPSYRLTPKTPYQASPEAWFEVQRPEFYAPAGEVLWWEPPREFDTRTGFRGMSFSFSDTPDRRSVASLSLSGMAFEGALGHLTFHAQLVTTPLVVPIDRSFGSHTVDFTFVPPQESIDIFMALLPGIELLTFTGISLAAAPPVVDPGGLALDG